jgi:proline iminopeptidase
MGTILPHIEALSERQTVILYDQRGGGRSDLPADTTLLEAQYFIEDLEAVRQNFGLERMNLLAHSFGAILAARFAQENPDKVARMAFLGATGPVRTQAAAAAQAVYTAADTSTLRELMGVMRELLSGTAPDVLEACRRYEELSSSLNTSGAPSEWKGSSCDASDEAVAYYFRHTAQKTPASFDDWDFTSGLEGVAAPLLVIHGEADSTRAAGQMAWANALPEGRILVITGAGKGAIAERPETVIEAIDVFVRGSWPGDARTPSPPGQ